MIDQRLHDVLNGKEANYILPFYWQYGDHTNRIPQQIKEIFDSGCRGLCIESKSHPDFIGKGWWKDMDVIFAEAEKLGMRVWILYYSYMSKAGYEAAKATIESGKSSYLHDVEYAAMFAMKEDAKKSNRRFFANTERINYSYD